MKCILVENGKLGFSWWVYNVNQGEVNMGTQSDNTSLESKLKIKW